MKTNKGVFESCPTHIQRLIGQFVYQDPKSLLAFAKASKKCADLIASLYPVRIFSEETPTAAQLRIAKFVGKEIAFVSKHCKALIDAHTKHITVFREPVPGNSFASKAQFFAKLKTFPFWNSITFETHDYWNLLLPLVTSHGAKLKELRILNPRDPENYDDYGEELPQTAFLTQCVNLEVLEASTGNNENVLKHVATLTKLQFLDVYDGYDNEETKEHETSLQHLSKLTNLTYLGLSGFYLNDMSTLTQLTNLRSLGVYPGDGDVSAFGPIGKCTQLTTLKLQNVERGFNIQTTLYPLKNLRKLTLCLAPLLQIQEVKLDTFPQLTHLCMGYKTDKYTGVDKLTRLHTLRLENDYPSWMSSVTANLKTLSVSQLSSGRQDQETPNQKLQAIATRFTQLQILNIDWNTDLTVFTPLHSCTQLQELHVKKFDANDEKAYVLSNALQVFNLWEMNLSEQQAIAKLRGIETQIRTYIANNPTSWIKDLYRQLCQGQGSIQTPVGALYTGGIPPDQLQALRQALPNLRIKG